MPFVSESQRRLLWMKAPKVAEKWAKEYPNQGPLPYHKGDGPIGQKLRRARGGSSGRTR